MFYKEQTKPEQIRKSEKHKDPNQEFHDEQMQALVNSKLEQLDKAIEKYNQENERVCSQKREYEDLMRKVRIETRELETLKKRMSEDVEKVKQEELDKIKKEKKALEARQKNLNIVSNNSKREREEIDQLKKDFSKIQADSELKQ